MIKSTLVQKLFTYKNGKLFYENKQFGITIEKDGRHKIKINNSSYFEHELINLFFKEKLS